MKTIVINSQKGGSGKTTLCAHLAVAAEMAGDGPVCLIDTDPQGTLSTWHEQRVAEVPMRGEVALPDLAHGLGLLAEHGVNYCFIDTAPTRTDENLALFRMADLVLVPIRPSPSDLWAVSATVALLKQTTTPFLFVLNQTKTNAGITAQAAAALSTHGRVAEAFIADRVPYAAAMTDGRTAVELAPKGPAAEETLALWGHVKAQFTQAQQPAASGLQTQSKPAAKPATRSRKSSPSAASGQEMRVEASSPGPAPAKPKARRSGKTTAAPAGKD